MSRNFKFIFMLIFQNETNNMRKFFNLDHRYIFFFYFSKEAKQNIPIPIWTAYQRTIKIGYDS